MRGVAFNFARASYRALRRLPLIGPAMQRLRESYARGLRLNVYSTIAQLQDLLAAHSIAIAGLRQANGFLLEEVERRLDSRIHQQNLKLDKDRTEISQRMEFMRAETMLELRRLVRADLGGSASQAALATTIINPDKLATQRQRGALKVNVGCGHVPMDDYINVDFRSLPGVDVVSQVDKLPFQAGEVSEIHGAHIAEHFPQHVFTSQVLPAWHAALKRDGVLRLIVPNSEAMMRAWAAGKVDFETLSQVILGGQEYEGDFHYALYTPETLKRLLEAAQFRDVQIVAEARQNGLCLEMELIGCKA